MTPMMWIGAKSLSNTRLDLYEALIDKLNNTSASSVERLDEIFGQWAKRDRDRKDSRATAMNYVHRQLERGRALSEALKPFIPVDEALILQSGEIRGNLPQALQLVVRNMQAGDKMRSSVGAAMAQPALGVLSLLGLSVGFGLMMWPDILRGVPLKHWPAWTHLCIDTQLWLGHHWPWLFTLAGFVVAYYMSLTRWTGKYRTWADLIPPYSIYRGQLASSFLGVLAALVESGKTVRESLELMQDNSSPYMRWRIAQIIRKLDISGEEGIKALRTGFFSQQIMDRIEDASSNRTFGATLRYIGENALRLIVRAVEKQADVANVIFLMIVGAAFLYTTSVVVIGMQEATESLTRSMGMQL